MGGAASITMILGMIKTKFAAVLIGTGGVGLLASFTTIQSLVGTLAGLGIQQSGVRDVAAAVASGDQEAIGRVVLTLRRMCWLTGLLGMITLVVISPLIGQFTFGTDKYNLEIASLGLIILFANITGGQTALIQGSRRIGDIARLQMIGAAVGTIVTVGFYFWIGLRGIVPALVLASFIQLLVSWRYAKRVSVTKVAMSWRASFKEAGAMVRLGIAMMWTGLASSLVVYATIAMITDQFDLHAVGIYSAAFSLSGMFVNFVLQAMGADYYPRLTGVAHDKAAMNKLVNEQTEIGLLLAVPGILATLVLAPWIIHLFYTKDFLPAGDLLQWFIFGCMGQVISWPLGFVMLALGEGMWYTLIETSFRVVQVITIGLFLHFFGLVGVAASMPLLYIGYTVMVLMVAKRLTGFSWSPDANGLIFKSVLVGGLAFIIMVNATTFLGTILGLIMVAAAFVFSLRDMVNRLGMEHRFTRHFFRIPGAKLLMWGLVL